MNKFARIPEIVLGTFITDLKMKILCIQIFALANFGKSNESGQSLAPGQMITTLSDLMELTGLTKKEVRIRLDKLVADGKLKKVGTNRNLILTIVGYDKYFATSNNSGMHETRSKAYTNSYISMSSNQNSISCGTQNGTPAALCTENNKENIVENVNMPTTGSSIEGRRKWLIDECNAVIKAKGWEEYSRTIPEFNDAVKKFITYMGTDLGGKLRYEKYSDFTVSGRLTYWINHENALKGKINLQ